MAQALRVEECDRPANLREELRRRRLAPRAVVDDTIKEVAAIDELRLTRDSNVSARGVALEDRGLSGV